MIKTLGKLGIKRENLFLIKGVYRKPTANTLNGERLSPLYLRWENKARMSPLTTSLQRCTEGPSQ